MTPDYKQDAEKIVYRKEFSLDNENYEELEEAIAVALRKAHQHGYEQALAEVEEVVGKALAVATLDDADVAWVPLKIIENALAQLRNSPEKK